MAKIDPAFQAAPYLGDSAHNPIEFARRQNLQKWQIQRARKEEQDKNTAIGLQNIMVDIKGWEDQQGFKEITADQDRIMNGFLELSRKGLNLVSPKTTHELMAYKAITDAHEQLKQKVDTWNTQKGMYDLIKKAIEVDSAKQPDDQVIDHAATLARADIILKSKSIYDRGNILQGLLVTKPQVGDVHKYVNENDKFITKPNKIQMPYTDPETGLQGSVLRDQMTPEVEKQRIEDYRNLYKTAPDKVKAGVKKARSQDQTDDKIMSDEDYFVGMYNQKYKNTLINKISSASGGDFAINFGKSGVKLNPGEHNTNNNWIGGRNYNDRYDFSTNGKLFKVQSKNGYQHNSTPNPTKGTDGWNEIKGGDYVEAELLFYDTNKNVLVFRSGQAAQNPYIGNNVTFEVPLENFPEALKLPIPLNGKKGTLKDILPKEATVVKKKVYNPKTGKFE